MNVSRRDLLITGGGALLLSGCSLFDTDPAQKGGTTTGAAATDAKESPMLAELVKSGKLPPLVQRLPAKPMVVKPLSEAGRYGGTMQRGTIDANYNDLQYLSFVGLTEWTPTTPPTPQPALAESWDIEQDGKVYVFHLRQGVKWSDGQPFTTDDLMYVIQHYFGLPALSPGFPTWLSTSGKPGRFSAVDKYTLRMEFAEPNGLLLKYLSFVGTSFYFLQPAHYLKQFHERFADPAKLKQLIREAKQDNWTTLYAAKHDPWKNPERPVLGAWRLTKPLLGGNTAAAERNPYFWKVDSDGRQLPYIDKVAVTLLDSEALGLRAANGQIDLAGSSVSFQSAPVLIRNAEQKPYQLRRWPLDGQFHIVYFNMSHPDPVLRELFQNIDFRAGVSHAINRKEINESLLAGQGIITQACAQPEDPYFVEGMGQRFIDHDLAKANAALDSAGLSRRGPDGFRLRPDGRPLQITTFTFNVGVGLPMVDVLEFVRRHLAKAGLKMAIKTISDKLWYDQIPQGRYDSVGYPGAGYLWDIDSLWYVPTSGLTYWAPNYGTWYSNPKDRNAMKPEGEIRQTQVLYDQLQREADDKARIEIGRQILRLHDKNVWMIGTVRPPFHPVVVADDLGNVRDTAVASFRTHYEGATDLAQTYFKNPDQHR